MFLNRLQKCENYKALKSKEFRQTHSIIKMMASRGINYIIIGSLISVFFTIVNGQDRRPTISFITQPEIVTDIGGTVEMKCSVQVG